MGNPLPKTLAFWCSLSLLQVCLSLAAKTMRKGRNHPRNLPRNEANTPSGSCKPVKQVLCRVKATLAEWELLAGRREAARGRLAPLLEAPGPLVSYSKEALAMLA